MHQTFNQQQVGFTIIELIVVITVTSILAAMSATFIRNPTQAYLDTEANADLTDRADVTLRRVAREVRNALPNSVRVSTSGADTLLEIIPVKAAGRYRAEVGNNAADNPLDFTVTADTFDVLGQAVSISAGDKMVIYNLGTAGSDAYEGSNIRPLLTSGSLNTLSFNGGAFPFASPASRFYVVSTAMSFACDMTNQQLIMVGGYAIQSAQATSVASLSALATPHVLASQVSSCQINYAAGALQRSGIITITLGLIQGQAKVNLVHQINIMNSP